MKKYCCPIVVSFITIILSLIAWSPSIVLTVYSDTQDTDLMIYYDSLKDPILDADHHSHFFSVQQGRSQTIKYYVSKTANLNTIRIDFNEIDKINIYKLVLNVSPFEKITYNADELNELFTLYNDISAMTVNDKGCILNDLKQDAWIYASDILRSDIGVHSVSYECVIKIFLLIICSIFMMYMETRHKNVALQHRQSALAKNFWSAFKNVCYSVVAAIYIDRIFLKIVYKLCCLFKINKMVDYFSSIQYFSYERILFFFLIIFLSLIIVNMGLEKAIKYRYLIVAILFFFLVVGRYNLSSIGAFDKMLFNNSENYQTVILGNPQGIRADEWAIEKPYYFAQTVKSVKCSYYNYNLMLDGADMVVMGFAPVKDMLILARPALWGFLFLPAEYAFSFYWWSRILLLFLAAFELGRILLQNDKLAIGVAVALAFSAPVQWLMSQWLIEILYAGMYAVVFWDKLLKANSKKKICYACIVAFWINVYIYSLYPAAEIPFGYVFISMAAYVILLNKNHKFLSFWNILCVLIIIMITGIMAVHFLSKSMDAVKIMANTVYPGHNRVWGGYSWDYELFSFINLFSSTIKDSNYLNNCESAKFMYFLPFLCVAIIMLWKKGKSDIRVYGLSIIFLTAFSMFCCCNLHERNIITDIIFLKNSYPRRIYLAVGFGFFWSMWLSISCLLSCKDKILSVYMSAICSILTTLILIFAVFKSTFLIEYFQAYSNENRIFLIGLCAVYGWIGYLLLNNSKKFCFMYILVSVLSTIFVNPISVGIDCLYKKDSLEIVREILSKDENSRWIISGNAGIGNLVSMQGIKRCSGYYYYPDIEMMKIIDPDEKYKNLWNSFTAVDMRLTTGENYIESPDGSPAIVVYIDIDTARKLDIKYIYNYGNVEIPLDMLNLDLIYTDDIDPVDIYKIN